MEALIIHPKNKTQLALLKKLAKEMDILFEIKSEQEVLIATAKMSTSEKVLNKQKITKLRKNLFRIFSAGTENNVKTRTRNELERSKIT